MCLLLKTCFAQSLVDAILVVPLADFQANVTTLMNMNAELLNNIPTLLCSCHVQQGLASQLVLPHSIHWRTADALHYVLSLFWTATKKNYSSKCSKLLKKLIDTITTSNFYSKFKENNVNDMAEQVFWAVFYSRRRPSQIGPTADFNGTAVPSPIFSMIPSYVKMGWKLK